ncbi:J domain-containing protein [Altericista sp. CCNU0014]|uniref:J domain-containing protein n=1 Tax=Altericista sp. CCNU0014 TaxID=3082949 RepID=UPI00384B7957
MIEFDPYKTLEVGPKATPAQIKEAYRRLVKQFHPDSQHALAHHDNITRVNAAYELLKDSRRRQAYDDRCFYGRSVGVATAESAVNRNQRAKETQDRYRQDRQTRRAVDAHLQEWIQRVYTPIDRELTKIMKRLKPEIVALSADPYDDELMDGFLLYLEDCQAVVSKAQAVFRSMPNPASVAGVAAHLYYCLNHLEDGLTEFNWFAQSYEDSYLASGKEMFRKSTGLRREARTALKDLQSIL